MASTKHASHLLWTVWVAPGEALHTRWREAPTRSEFAITLRFGHDPNATVDESAVESAFKSVFDCDAHENSMDTRISRHCIVNRYTTPCSCQITWYSST